MLGGGLAVIVAAVAVVTVPGPQLDWLGLRDSYPPAQSCEEGVADPGVALAAGNAFANSWSERDVNSMDSRGKSSCAIKLPDGYLWMSWGHTVPDRWRTGSTACKGLSKQRERGIGDEAYSCTEALQEIIAEPTRHKTVVNVLTGWQEVGVTVTVADSAEFSHQSGRCIAEALAKMRNMPVVLRQCPSSPDRV